MNEAEFSSVCVLYLCVSKGLFRFTKLESLFYIMEDNSVTTELRVMTLSETFGDRNSASGTRGIIRHCCHKYVSRERTLKVSSSSSTSTIFLKCFKIQILHNL